MPSEAQDAELAIEQMFNEEILEQRTPEEPEPIFPGDEPEAKPLPDPETPVEEEQDEEEQAPQETEEEAPPEAEEAPQEPQEVEPQEEEEEHLAWARKQYGDDIDLSSESSQKLARAAYEKERLLGKKAEEAKALQEQAQRAEVQARIDALNTPGALTPDEQAWVDEAIVSDDPGEWAYQALRGQRPDIYAAVMDRWSTLGEVEARRARAVHSRVMMAVTAPQPSEQESYAAALGQTFVSLGLDIERDGPTILAKAEELGAEHPAVIGMMSPDDSMRLLATRAVYDLVTSTRTEVARHRTEDVVAQRLREEELRRGTEGITTTTPRPPEKKDDDSGFWEKFDAEVAERGWDGQRPSYRET